MLINFKKIINLNVVIGILLILVIIYILYNKKQEVFSVNPTLSPEEELKALYTALDELVASCFDKLQEPLKVSEMLDKDILTTYSQEIYTKLDELILPALYYVVKVLKITAIDFNCGNSEDDSHLINTLEYLLKIVKSLAIVFNEILDISYDNTTSLPPLKFEDDMELIKQIACLRKKNLPYDDTILDQYNLYNIEVNEKSSIYTFSIKLLEFIHKLASGIPAEECLDVDLTQKSDLPSKYIYFDGVERQCNPSIEPPNGSATLPPNGSATLPPNGSATLPPNGSATLPPNGSATLPSTIGSTFASNGSATLQPTNRSSDTTLTGYDSGIFGSSYSNVKPVPNNLPRGINLINSQGPNNFFLPNIRIS
jgi:hypothetical protein